MTVLHPIVMERPTKKTVRRKVNPKIKIMPKKLVKSSEVSPMPSVKDTKIMAKAPKRRNPSATMTSDMISKMSDRIIGELNESKESKDKIKIRRRTPSTSALNASEALLSLKNSAITFDDIQQKKGEETIGISPFLKLPKSMPNTVISNVTNISHKYSSANSTSPRSKSDSEVELERSFKDNEFPEKSLKEQDLPYPPPSKKAKTSKFDDFQLKKAVCFLPPSEFLANKSFEKRNDYQAQIDELKAKNEFQSGSEDFVAKLTLKSEDDLKAKNEESQAKSDPLKARSDLLEFLECSSCKKLPKHDLSRPNIYGCSQGHLMCQNCSDIVEKCPVCSEKDVKNRSAFAERIMNKIFPNVQKSHVQCRFKLCKAELNIKDLKDHETFCIYREVPCPSTHRGACKWKGPLSQLIQHVKENKCVQVIFDDSWYNNNTQSVSGNQNMTTSSFKSNLGDFPSTEKSVFERNDVITHWKPVLLLSKRILNLWCYVVIQRDFQGLWRLMAYSMLPKACTDKINVKLTVGDPETGRSFNFSGKLTSYESSLEESIQEGNFLYLHDAQIKPFKIDGEPTLFHYNVEVEGESKLISLINLRSQKISMNNGPSVEKKITEKDIIPKLPKLTPKPAARFNVTFKNSDISGNMSETKVKVEPVEVQLD